MRIVENNADRLVTQDDAMGWGAAFMALGAALAGLTVWLAPTMHSEGAQIAMFSGATLAALIGARLASRLTATFERQRNLFSVVERRVIFRKVQEARLDEVQDVYVARNRGGHAGPSHRAVLKVRNEVWPLATTFRDRRSATRTAEAVARFLAHGS